MELSSHLIYLQVELYHKQIFEASVAAIIPQTSLLYDEHGPLMTQPSPVVIHHNEAVEQALSVLKLFDKRAHVRLIQEVPFHPHEGTDPEIIALLQS